MKVVDGDDASPQARECLAARLLVARLSGVDQGPTDKPDAPGRPSRRGGRPDYEFGGGEMYVEVTSLLRPGVRRLEDRLRKQISAPVGPRLTGIYILHADLDVWESKSRDRRELAMLRETIEMWLTRDPLPVRAALGEGVEISRAREDGGELVPWVERSDPWNIGMDDSRWLEIEATFKDVVAESNRKFADYSGRRVLLIDVSLVLIDSDIHARDFLNPTAPIAAWLENSTVLRENVDEIYLEPGMPVWRPATGQRIDRHRLRVLTGHRYLHWPRGFYVRVWPAPRQLI